MDRLLTVGIVIMVLACAGQPQGPSPATGQCDAVIDQAVQDGDWEKALADHEQLLTRRPNDCLAMYHLGYIWGQLGDRAQEIHFYEQAADCGYRRDDLLFFNMAMAKADIGDFDGALRAFKEAAAINPKNPENYYGMGSVFQATGRPKDAEQAWLRALKLDPRHQESLLALAALYLDQSRWNDARIQLDALQKLAPENQEAQELRELLKSRQALEYRR